MSQEQPISVSKFINPPIPFMLADKNDPVFLKYSVLSSSWNKDLRVHTQEINPEERPERIKQKNQSVVQ